MKIGIIGFGNIGKMLGTRLSEFFKPSDITVFDPRKLRNGKYTWVSAPQDVIDRSDIIFLCIRPQSLKSFSDTVTVKDKIIVTTIAAIYENSYYKFLGKIKLVRVIPSMINKIGGPILFQKGKYANDKDSNKIKKLLSRIGSVYQVKETEIDAYTHLSSCSPALVAQFLKLYLDLLITEKKVNRQKALKVLVETLEILVPLIKKDGFKIIPQVCTKGGITEQGINILNDYKDTFFKDIAHSLLARMNVVRNQYGK